MKEMLDTSQKHCLSIEQDRWTLVDSLAQGSAALAIQEEVRVMAQKVTIAEYWQLAKVNEAEERDTVTQGKANEKAALKNLKVTDWNT